MSIKKELVSGIIYTAISKYSGIAISLVITAVLSRILSPDDFGTVAIATVIIAFFSIFTDMGLSPAIIQNKSLSKADLSNIFSFTLWIGTVLTVSFFISSWLIGSYYNNKTLVTICQLLSINLFFASLNIVPNALLYKNKEFKYIAIRSLIIQTIGGGVGISAALLGAGMYALVINPILSSIFIFLISFRKYPQKANYTLGLQTIKKIFSYSAYQFLFNIINYFSRNLDKILIGKYLGMNQLGYYEKSYRLMMLPLQNITQVITPVMHPVLSDYQNDLNQLAVSYEKIIRLLAFIGFPLSIFLLFTSEELILILFGQQWEPSIPVFRILALTVGTQVILSSSGSIFQAASDTKSLFICGVFSSSLNIIGIYLGVFVFNSLESVAWCILIAFTINFIQCYWQMYNITFKRKFLVFMKQIVPAIILSIIIYIAMSLLCDLEIISKTNIYIKFAFKSVIYIAITIIFIQLTNEYDFSKHIKRKMH